MGENRMLYDWSSTARDAIKNRNENHPAHAPEKVPGPLKEDLDKLAGMTMKSNRGRETAPELQESAQNITLDGFDVSLTDPALFRRT